MKFASSVKSVILFVFFVGFVFQIMNVSATFAADEAVKEKTDTRFTKLRSLNSDFTWHAPKTLAEWEKRAPILRRQIQLATGLWPMPDHSEPPKAIVHGRVEREDFTVDRVILETMPGVYLTGSLFKPKGKSGKMPVVLTPHGHWANGRFFREEDAQFKANMKNDAEHFESASRHPLQAICVHLARMGCAAFFYDTLGNADNLQIGGIAHNFHGEKPLPELNGGWGFYNVKAEGRMESIMGLQTWNSVRALDFVSSLPDVDTTRIGVTGGSGGGTQTFILCAIDQRPAAAFPAVMVSAEMQGGCTCENACYLRIGTSNIEIAGLTAPRPMGMTAARDWTFNMAKNGFPDLQDLYSLYGKKDLVKLFPFLKYGHNYNSHSRHAMYAFFNEHLKIGATDEQLKERDFKPLSVEELTVYNDEHPKPKFGAEAQYAVLKAMTEQSDKSLVSIFNVTDKKSFDKFQEVVGGAWETMIGNYDWSNDRCKWESKSEPKENTAKFEGKDIAYKTEQGVVANEQLGSRLPTNKHSPNSATNKHVIWIDVGGYTGPTENKKVFDAHVVPLLNAGITVWCIDIYKQDGSSDNSVMTSVKFVDKNKEFMPYTFGYNPPLFARRVQNVLTTVRFIESIDPKAKIGIVSERGTGEFAAVSRVIAKEKIAAAVVVTDGSDIGEVNDFSSHYFLPGAAKYGGNEAVLALSAPLPLYNICMPDYQSSKAERELVVKSYEASGSDKTKNLVFNKDMDATRARVFAHEWLIEQLK